MDADALFLLTCRTIQVRNATSVCYAIIGFSRQPVLPCRSHRGCCTVAMTEGNHRETRITINPVRSLAGS